MKFACNELSDQCEQAFGKLLVFKFAYTNLIAFQTIQNSHTDDSKFDIDLPTQAGESHCLHFDIQYAFRLK